MAKKSAIEKNKHRRELVKKFAGRRERLLAVANDESKSMVLVSSDTTGGW